MLYSGKHAQGSQIAFLASADGDAVIQGNHRRSGHNSRHLLQNRVHVIDGQQVGSHIALLAALVFGIDKVGAYGLDLIENVLLAGHPDRDHQDERSGANHHTQRGQSEANLVSCRKYRRQN